MNSDLLETWNVGSLDFAYRALPIIAQSGLGQNSSISIVNLRIADFLENCLWFLSQVLGVTALPKGGITKEKKEDLEKQNIGE